MKILEDVRFFRLRQNWFLGKDAYFFGILKSSWDSLQKFFAWWEKILHVSKNTPFFCILENPNWEWDYLVIAIGYLHNVHVSYWEVNNVSQYSENLLKLPWKFPFHSWIQTIEIGGCTSFCGRHVRRGQRQHGIGVDLGEDFGSSVVCVEALHTHKEFCGG